MYIYAAGQAGAVAGLVEVGMKQLRRGTLERKQERAVHVSMLVCI